MKTTPTTLGIVALGLVLAGVVKAQVPTNGLVAYYPFDGDANDASGNKNNLVNHGATLCADRFGVANQAYFFDGTSYLGSSIPPLTQVDNWTVSAWIQPASLAQMTAYAVCVGYDSGSAGDGFGVGLSGQGSDGTGFGTSNQLYGMFPGVGFIHADYQFTSTNQWELAVLERSSGTLMFYLDGIFVTNDAPTLITPGTPTSFEVGSGGSSARFFKGAIDEVRIYDRVLSMAEVQQLYDFSAAGCPPRTAIAAATVSSGFVISVNVTDGGCGYSNAPLVQIVGGGGTGATATATVANGMVVDITITDAGSGYFSAPAIVLSAPAQCSAHSATAVATVTNGFVIAAEIIDTGCGYTNTPSVQIVGGGGTGAAATAIVTNGEVVGITITDAGLGYSSVPAVYINSPLGAVIILLQAVVPAFSDMAVGSNYQLQASSDLAIWTNQGAAFLATNSTMIFTQYYNVLNGSQLYFRLQGAP
jgi:hypothetical protein